MFDNRKGLAHTPNVPDLLSSQPSSDSGYPARTDENHEFCLNGHRLDVSGRSASYDHSVHLSTSSCDLCWELHLPRWTWLVIDHRRLQHEAPASHAELVLAARPPEVKAGVGQIELRLRGQVIADIDVRLCGVDTRGVIEQVRVDEKYQRRGFGTVLVAAALARGPAYRWSTTKLDDSVGARAFWASLRPAGPLQLGEPFYCSHMRLADGDRI